MPEEDLAFLREQVSRLSLVLARYQEAFPNFVLKELDLSSDLAKELPWLENKKQISPLLQEYDAIIFGLKSQLASLQNEFERLRSQSSQLIEENEKLHQELKDSIQSRVSLDRGAGDDGEVGSDFLIENLQRQLDLLNREKDAAQERWREAVQEVDRLEALLEVEKDSHQWNVVEQQADQVREQYQQSVTALTLEVETLHNDLRESRTENTSLVNKLSEMKVKVGELQQQLIWKAQEHADSIFKENLSDSKVQELKIIMDELRERLSEMNKEKHELQEENTVHLVRISELQRRLFEAEAQEKDAVAQVRESVQMVETAMLERDQAVILVRQREQELDEMKGILGKLINKAGARTREEVDLVRNQCNQQISKLTQELHALEMEGAEKQSRLDRLLREKRAVESELQQIYKEGLLEGSKSKESYQDLNKRAIDAERARDEALVRIENLQGQLDRLNMEHQQQRQQMQAEIRQLQERLSGLQSEFQAISEDRIHHQDKMNELDKKLLEAQQERDAAQRKFLKELALVEQEQHVKVRDFEVRLHTTEDAHRQTVLELRNLLTAQQRMSARWKEECHTITHKFECQVQDMRTELSQLRKRNEELTSLLKESQSKTADIQRMLSEYTQNIGRMEERVRESQKQAAEASKQVAIQSIRAKQMAVERESLLTDLARSQRNNESIRSVGLKMERNPQVVSDVRVDQIPGHSLRGKLTVEQLTLSIKQHSARGSNEDR